MPVVAELLSIFGIIALILSAWNWRQQRLLEQRIVQLLGDIDETSLQEALTVYYRRVKKTDAKLSEILKAINELAKVSAASSQKTAIIRFNPFGDTGGDQSFALAVLDGHDSGYILTSMHGREGTRIYVKPIESGQSKYQLSKEESQALGQAIKQQLL